MAGMLLRTQGPKSCCVFWVDCQAKSFKYHLDGLLWMLVLMDGCSYKCMCFLYREGQTKHSGVVCGSACAAFTRLPAYWATHVIISLATCEALDSRVELASGKSPS